MRLVSKSEAETIRIGEIVGEVLLPGDLVLLRGELGSGKTTMVKGIARGLGCEEEITSASFVLVTIYEGRIPLCHVDLYRVDSPCDVEYLAFDELASPSVVCVVEWADRLESLSRRPFLEIEISYLDEEKRLIELKSASAERLLRLEQAFAQDVAESLVNDSEKDSG